MSDYKMPVDLNFTSVSSLRKWLERKREEKGSPEAYDDWLQEFFDEGNSMSVLDQDYDYWACWELL